jgi:putative oxidoreductase
MNTLANRGVQHPVNSAIAPSVADAAALVGRILLAILFLKSGWGKIGGFEQTAAMMASKGIPMAQVALIVTIVVELGAGILLVIGYKARWAALAIAAWLVPVTLMFHGFWAVPADQVMNQTNHFFKNVAIFGGMLMVFAFGPGRYSLDRQ